MKRSIFIATVLLCITAWGQQSVAQIQQPRRYEREQKNSEDYFYIIPLKERGLALFRERDKYKQSNKIWELVYLDTALAEVKTLEIEIRERHRMVGYEVADDRLYFLFRTGDNNKNDFVLIDVTYDQYEINRHTINPDLDFKLTHFVKAGNSFVFGGYVNNEAVIVLYDIASSTLKVIPGFFQKDTELVDLRTNQNQTFNTILIDRSNRGEKKILFRTFDDTGKQLLEDNVPIPDDYTLQTGLSSILEREELMIAGTWGDRNSKQSHGFYTLPVNPFADQKINFVEFGELQNFVNYLPEKRADRIRKHTRDAVAAGKRSAFSAQVMPFRMIEHPTGFYLLAEVYNAINSNSLQNSNPFFFNPYYPPYGYNPFWPGFYYPGMSRMYRPFLNGPNTRTTDEIKTLETVVISFDADGKVKWDQSITLDEVRLPALEQVGDFVLAGNTLHLIYKKESELKVKSVVPGSEEVKEETVKIQTANDQDVIKSEKESESGVRHWYGNTLYVWGYQTIRNVTRDERVRDVFYINRIDTR